MKTTETTPVTPFFETSDTRFTQRGFFKKFLTITLPTVLAIGCTILFSCYLFRLSGWCCRLFSDMPVQERKPKSREKSVKTKTSKTDLPNLIVNQPDTPLVIPLEN